MKRRKIDTSRPVRALERAAEYGVVSYPRNGAGRGYSVAVEGRGNEEVAMPNLEWCARPITAQDMAAQPEAAWGKRPLPACYAPLHPHMYPRSGWLGTWGRHDIEQTSEYEHGYFSAAVLDALEQQQHASRGFFSTAAAGLNQPCLKGGEAVRLQHLHPEMAVVTTHLPTERPRLLIEPPNTRMFELEAKLKTVVVEPELERLTLTWSGSLKVAGVYPESMCEEMRHAALWA